MWGFRNEIGMENWKNGKNRNFGKMEKWKNEKISIFTSSLLHKITFK